MQTLAQSPSIETLFHTLGTKEILAFIDERRGEDLTLDFKLAPSNFSNRDDRKTLAVAIAGFANSSGGLIDAFYALANGAVAHRDVSAKMRGNMPDPIPVMVLARLAVDSAYQGQGLGSSLLKDALLRTLAAAQIAGIRAMLLHAMSEKAKRFYERAGFYECPVDPMMMMMITLEELEKNLVPA